MSLENAQIHPPPSVRTSLGETLRVQLQTLSLHSPRVSQVVESNTDVIIVLLLFILLTVCR